MIDAFCILANTLVIALLIARIYENKLMRWYPLIYAVSLAFLALLLVWIGFLLGYALK